MVSTRPKRGEFLERAPDTEFQARVVKSKVVNSIVDLGGLGFWSTNWARIKSSRNDLWWGYPETRYTFPFLGNQTVSVSSRDGTENVRGHDPS